MKCDAHCAFDEGFDVKMMDEMHDDWTMVPIMRNLHVFDWVCSDGHRRYQGHSGPCEECGKETKMDIVWIAKTNPQSTSYTFDIDPHFQYFREFKKRPEGKGDITETMSLQGSCFMVTRDKFFELNLCDESFGSWGSQGVEIAVKTWTSGGRVVCNHKTFYAHLFRTKGGDFGFPWPVSGKQTQRAKKYAKDLFFNNKWDKQIRPLSWLIERFKPVPVWHDDIGKETLAQVMKSGSTFTNSINNDISVTNVIGPLDSVNADLAIPETILPDGQDVTVNAVGFSGINGRRRIASQNILSLTNEFKMPRITASRSVTDNMIENGSVSVTTHREGISKPGKNQSMNKKCSVMPDGCSKVLKTNLPISSSVDMSCPYPTISHWICRANFDFGKNSINNICGKAMNCEIFDSSHDSSPGDGLRSESGERLERSPDFPSILSKSKKNVKGVVYYTDNKLEERISVTVRKQLLNIELPIVSVSLMPIDFGNNIVFDDMQRGYLTMFKQILAGLEASEADVVFFAEHDVIYSKSHFEFIPSDPNMIYYNLNIWQLRSTDGHAVYYDAKRTSQLCAYRNVLIEHYRERVRRVEKDGFSRKIGFEPGSHNRKERIDDLKSDTWVSEHPNIDIKHGKNLTSARWSTDKFRSQKNCQNWKDGGEIPYWGVTENRFMDFLRDI